MLVVEWNPNAVEAETSKELGVCFGKEVFEKLFVQSAHFHAYNGSTYLVEEELGLVLANNFCQSGTNLMLAAGVSCSRSVTRDLANTIASTRT